MEYKMESNEIFELVKEYFINEFEIPEEKIVLEATLFEELELDSIDALDMIGMLESKLDIEIDIEELTDILTVQDVIQFIMKLLSNQ